jgi:hypothetical protein
MPHLRTDMHIDIVMAIPTSTLITKTVLLSKSLVLKPIMTIVTAADDDSAVTYFVSYVVYRVTNELYRWWQPLDLFDR